MDKIDYMELRERWVNLIGFGDLEKIELNIFFTLQSISRRAVRVVGRATCEAYSYDEG